MSRRDIQAVVFLCCGLLLHGCGKNPTSSHDPGPSGQVKWVSLGRGMAGDLTAVRALAILNGDLYAGGTFTHAGDVEADGIARWNGMSWSPVGTGLTTNTSGPGVHALQVFRGQLYAGGVFVASNGEASGLARWDGTSWQPVPGWTGGQVFALAVYNGMLAVAANQWGAVHERIVTLTDGTGIWHEIGAFDATPSALLVWRGDLVAMNNFSIVNGDSMVAPIRWDGTLWRSCAGGAGAAPAAFHSPAAVYGNDLVCAGLHIQGYSCPILRWNGSQWSCMNVGISSLPVGLLRVCDGKLYVGGAVATNQQVVGNVAVFEEDGRVTLLGRTDRDRYQGGYDPIQDVIIYGDQLVVAGGFSQVEGVSVGCIAMCKIK